MTLRLDKRLFLPFLALWLGFLSLAAGQDTEPPYVLAVNPPPGSTITYLDHIVVRFNEPLVGLYAEDLRINGESAHSMTQVGNSYCFSNLPAVSGGQIAVWFQASREVADNAGNLFDSTAAGNSWTYFLVDDEPPALTSVLPVPGATVTRLDTVEVVFSESVSGVTSGDLLVNGIAATNVTGSGLGPYRFTFPQPVAGVIQLSWAADASIYDRAQSPNVFAGSAWTNVLVAPESLGQVIINEFLANNTHGLKNEFGAPEDWIELYNPGSTAVDLLGWSLTDNKNYPRLWSLPNLTLNPGQYLVIFADGRHLTSTTNRYLHTNFKLNDQGDYLAICNADFPPSPAFAFEPTFPEQRPDYSYGRTADGSWGYLTPTPGGPNGASSVTNVCPLPHLNVAAGIYKQPFTLLASCELPEATLRFTTDGSIPTEANGVLYTQPLSITNTTVFRVASFAPGRLPSHVLTHTYLFLDGVLHQPKNPPGFPTGTNIWCEYYSTDYEMDPEIVTNNTDSVGSSLLALPTLAISMKTSDLFGTNEGIYSNPWVEDADRYIWERPCSVELLLTNGERAFQVDCGIRVQGNASRDPQKTPKHSFRLLFKGAYGPGQLNYPVFPDSRVQSFNALVLHSEYNNSWLHSMAVQRKRGSKVRDAWAKKTFSEMNGISGHSRPFHLYLNGLYWGVYDFGERVDAEFAASYLGGTALDWDAIASNPTVAINGNMDAYNTMVQIGRGSDMRQPTNYLLLQQYLDLPVFLDYMILNLYGANQDWNFDGNWNAIRRRAPGQTFKYLPWDAEQICVSNLDNRVTSTSLPSGLHTNLVKSPQYRLDFADRVQKYCFNNGLLTPGPAAERWMQIAREVGPGMLAESARWGDFRRDVYRYDYSYVLYTTNDHWWPEIQRMQNNYFPARTDIFLDQLRAAGLYPNIAAPVFSPAGGTVPEGTSVILSATNAIYYTLNGDDPRVMFSGEIAPSALVYTGPITITSKLKIKARAFDGANWSALNESSFQLPHLGSSLLLTEIMYNPIGGDAFEYIELYNRSLEPLDVSGWSFQNGINFTFNVGSVLKPGQVIVLASSTDPAFFAIRYPQVNVFGYYTYRLNNGGEQLTLVDQFGAPQISVHFKDGNGWPRVADGYGYSLELIDPLGDPEAASNWRATTFNGTPGVVAFGNPGGIGDDPSSVRLNEIMARNTGTVLNDGDWIELYNPSTNTVNLENWSLTDDSKERKFIFPTNTLISPDGYLIVWCDTNSTLPGLHSGFMLASDETVSLYDSNIVRVDCISFGIQPPNYTLGRIEGGWVLTSPTPGSTNSPAALASPTNLFINEWLANAPPGGSDWIELYNSSPDPVCLTDLFLTESNKVQQIRAHCYIGGGGYLQLFADEGSGPNHLNFRLPSSGGVIALYDPASHAIDEVSYLSAGENTSQGRFPDGSSNIVDFPFSPSPGASNYLPSASGPVINEIMARNRGAVTNSAGHAADWVEIYNPFSTYVNLSYYRLTTSYGDPGQWSFPGGVMLRPHNYIVVWFDRDRPATTNVSSEYNSGHALSGWGDQLYLLNSAGALIDLVDFGPQAANISIGRSGTNWVLLDSPTPGRTNSAPATLGNSTALLFNEWLASPNPGQDPFFEIYNPGALPVELSGLFLSDQLSLPSQAKFQIHPLSFIAPNDFTEFKADNNRSKGPNHVNFTLEPNGGALRLSSATLDPLAVLYYGVQTPGASQGLLPDGGNSISSFSCPTPGNSNALTANIIISEQPQAQTVLAGATVLLHVQSVGGGILGYQWSCGTSNIAQGNKSMLILTNVQENQTGDYRVQISNACALVSSEVVRLTVYGPPVIVTNPQNTTNTLGDNVIFSLNYSSSTPVTFQWFFKNQFIPMATNSTLHLDNVSFETAGFYSVSLMNTAGSVTSAPAALIIVGPPILLHPQIIGSDFYFAIEGPLFRNYTLQWAEMPGTNTWNDIATFDLLNNSETFAAPASTNSGFYRLRMN